MTLAHASGHTAFPVALWLLAHSRNDVAPLWINPGVGPRFRTAIFGFVNGYRHLVRNPVVRRIRLLLAMRIAYSDLIHERRGANRGASGVHTSNGSKNSDYYDGGDSNCPCKVHNISYDLFVQSYAPNAHCA
jgi:hypothetical protein